MEKETIHKLPNGSFRLVEKSKKPNKTDKVVFFIIGLIVGFIARAFLFA